MMWEKARVSGDAASEPPILEATTPKEVKALGRKVTGFDGAVWDYVREPLMVCGLRQKFLQNPPLMNELLSTGSALLAEGAPRDRVWGIGMGPNNPDVARPATWKGRNLLGRALMKTRDDLRLLSRCSSLEWSVDELLGSQVGEMTLSQLACVPSARGAVLVYQRTCGHLAPDLLEPDVPIVQLHDDSLVTAGFDELLDELAFRRHVGLL